METRKTVLVLLSDPSRKPIIDQINSSDSTINVVFQQVIPSVSVHRQLDRIREQINDIGHIGGVVGINDFASALAARVSQEFGFSGPSINSVYYAQHKALFAKHAAVCNPHFPPTRIIQSETDIPGEEKWYPGFLKPAAGSLSNCAFLVESPDHLREKYIQHVSSQRVDVVWREELFNPLMKRSHPSLNVFILQPFLHYPQYTADGYVFEGEVHWVGVTASVFDKSGHSFERFDFPAYLKKKTKDELEQVVEHLISRLNYDNGCFNVEFFVTDMHHVVLIEFNTRLAFQFVPLITVKYANNYLIETCRLALGEAPNLELVPVSKMSSSFVIRVYEDAHVVSTPRHEEIMEIINDGLAHSIRVMVREGTRLSDCKQDEYSFRYAIVNIIGKDQEEILNKQAAVKERLKFVFKSLRSLW